MSEQRWTDADGEPDDGVDVRHVQPYEAVKRYRCPGCDHDIRPGDGHEVVVPRRDPQARRHWHSGCWRGEQRRRTRPGRGR